MKHREPLDLYDTKPHGMSEYLRHNGWHFNRRMCEFAVSLMRKDGKRIDPWRKEDVDELLKSASEQIDCTDHDYVYVANMAKADFLGGCLADNSAVAKYVSDVLSDEDQADGFIFNRFYADCARNGVGIPWEDVL